MSRGVESLKQKADSWLQGLGTVGKGRDCSWVSLWGDERSGTGWWEWLHDHVYVLTATGLYTVKWLKWWILWYVNFISCTCNFNELGSLELASWSGWDVRRLPESVMWGLRC